MVGDKRGLVPHLHCFSVVFKDGTKETADPIRTLDSYANIGFVKIDVKGESPPHNPISIYINVNFQTTITMKIRVRIR
jgi:hypothetical protein